MVLEMRYCDTASIDFLSKRLAIFLYGSYINCLRVQVLAVSIITTQLLFLWYKSCCPGTREAGLNQRQSLGLWLLDDCL